MTSPPDGDTMRFRLDAPSRHALYLDHCNGAVSWGLEHEVAGTWKPAWIAMVNGCHSAPIRIPAGSFREFSEPVALDPGTHLPAGTYRLALYGVYSRHDADDHAGSTEVPHAERVSEPFAFGPLGGR